MAARTGEPPPVIDADSLLPIRQAYWGSLRGAPDPVRRGDAGAGPPAPARPTGSGPRTGIDAVNRSTGFAPPRPAPVLTIRTSEIGRTGAPDLRAARALCPRLNFAPTLRSDTFD